VNAFFAQADSMKPDAIINQSGPVSLLGTSLASAKAAGIPVFGLNCPPDPNTVAAVQQDSTVTEDQIAEYFCKAINYKGKVITVTQSDDPQIVLISAAIKNTLKKYPNIKVISDIHPDHSNDVDTLNTDITAFLTANPTAGSIAGVICAWGDPAIGAEEACETLGRTEVKVAGSDGEAAEMQQMLLPHPVAIISMHQDWPTMSQKLISAMQAYFNGTNKAYGQGYTFPSLIIDTPAEAQARLTYLLNLDKELKASATTSTT